MVNLFWRLGCPDHSVAMKDITTPAANSIARYRIHVTLATAAILGTVGFMIGWSIPTAHQDDRLADILFPTLGLAVFGALLGYTISSVYYRRMSAVDAFVCFAIPIFTFLGLLFAKSGDLFRHRVSLTGALAMIAYLVLRVCNSQMSKNKTTMRDDANDVTSRDS